MGRRALVLLVALLFAGVAAFAVFQFLNGIRNDVEADREKVTVFRADHSSSPKARRVPDPPVRPHRRR